MKRDVGKKRRKKKPQQDSPQVPSLPLTGQMVEQLEAWSDEAAQSLGLQILDVDAQAKGSWKIQIMAQRLGQPLPGEGITVDECAKISRYVELLMDTDDRVPENYILEVSSPGIERALRRPRHFAQVVGESIRLTVTEAIDGEYSFQGKLQRVIGEGPEQIELLVEESQKHNGQVLEIEIETIKKARVAHDFSKQ